MYSLMFRALLRPDCSRTLKGCWSQTHTNREKTLEIKTIEVKTKHHNELHFLSKTHESLATKKQQLQLLLINLKQTPRRTNETKQITKKYLNIPPKTTAPP